MYKKLFLNQNYSFSSVQTKLHYQKVLKGKAIGRYIGCPDKGDVADEHIEYTTQIHNGRLVMPSPHLNTMGFQLVCNPTKVKDFNSDDEIYNVYYKEIQDLIKRETGATKVFLFDHTLRSSSVKNLNNLGAKVAAGSVLRVHCDYTDISAPRRFKQLGEKESYTGFKLSPEEVDKLMRGRFAFINVWRGITDDPIQVKPLAVCDCNSVDPKSHLTYELRYEDRVGENYSLEPSPDHKWYYFPKMVKDECLMFYVYDKKLDGPRFTFHTAFEDPTTPKDAPDRHSIEARAIACYEDDFQEENSATFYDMIHSNNAARIRLFLRIKALENNVQSKMITYADLQSPDYLQVNPLKKVPAFQTENGQSIFESFVIMQYLEDKYGDHGSQLMPKSPEDRAFVNLLVRVHDIYISSPNNTQPNFSHSQGAMYLAPYATVHCAAERTMDAKTREAKIKEIWKQLNWLENEIKGPYMAGDEITHADLTWFPTCVFMEYMLPRNFGWFEIFHENQQFPKLTKWYENLLQNDIFKSTHLEIWSFWVMKDKDGQFDSIRQEVKEKTEFKWVYP